MDASEAARLVVKKLFPKKNKPVRCKSRWRKTLEKRMPEFSIVEAHPKGLFMTVSAKDPKDAQRLAEASMMSIIAFGTVGVLPGLMAQMRKT